MPTSPKVPFLGHYPGLIDDKGRLSIPADFRKAIGPDNDNMVVLTPGRLRFINAFPMTEFNKVWEQTDPSLLGFASEESIARDMSVLSPAVLKEIDGQGRITVPASLVKQSNIGHEVVFMGRYNHFVIWDAEAFEAFRSKHQLTPETAWKTILDDQKRKV
jgi:MraZ protein